jgi:glycosyltransferase involved in cell wall biosynthesis
MVNISSPDIAIYLRTIYDCGVDRVMVNLAQGFIDQGLKVDLLLNSMGGKLLGQFPREVRVINLKAPRLLSGLPKVIQYLRQARPTVLLSSGHYVNEIALWSKALSGTSTKVIVSEHNVLSMNAKLSPHERWSPLLAKLFYGWADNIVTVSHGVAQDLRQITYLSPSKVRVIYNPIVTPRLSEEAQIAPNHPWFKPGEPPVLLGIGRLEPQKDFSTLLRAFAKVRQSRSARLMILGKGREQKKLETLVQELNLENDVALVGFIENPYPYIAKASAFILSSAWEGLPTVLIEAMALGTPVISTNCESGPEEILAQGKYGALVPVGDSEAISNAILQVLAGHTVGVENSWLEQFSLDYATQKYLELFGIKVPESKLSF